MLQVTDVSLRFGDRKLFEDVKPHPLTILTSIDSLFIVLSSSQIDDCELIFCKIIFKIFLNVLIFQ